MKQYQRKQSKNLDVYFWNGLKLPRSNHRDMPNWVVGMCRVATPVAGTHYLIVETTIGVQRCYKPCVVIRNEDNSGAIAVSPEEFKRDYFKVII